MILEPTKVIKGRFWISLVPRWRTDHGFYESSIEAGAQLEAGVAYVRGMRAVIGGL